MDLENDSRVTASLPHRRASLVGNTLAACVLGWALALSCTVASAAPDAPVARPADERGLLDSVATKGNALMSQARDGASDLVQSAMNFLGVPYKRGGNSVESGFDCSGFTRHVFENSIGLVLPHRADEQAHASNLLKVDPKDLKPGDLVFFNTLRRTFSHVGIYMGDGKFIHSPRSGQTVRVEDMRYAYWARRFTGARRAPALGDVATAQAMSAGPNAAAAPLNAAEAALLGPGDSPPVPRAAAPTGLPLTLPGLPLAGLSAFAGPAVAAPLPAARTPPLPGSDAIGPVPR